MKLLHLIFFALLLFACNASKKSAANTHPLDGNWIPIRQEIGGKNLPQTVYEKYKLIITDTLYSYGTYEIDHGALLYKDGKMDIYGRYGVNMGKHYTAIYKMENGQLVICCNLKGDSYPAAFETTSKPTLFLSVYKKE